MTSEQRLERGEGEVHASIWRKSTPGRGSSHCGQNRGNEEEQKETRAEVVEGADPGTTNRPTGLPGEKEEVAEPRTAWQWSDKVFYQAPSTAVLGRDQRHRDRSREMGRCPPRER